MAENQILVKFKPSGHEELIKAINRLSTVQKKLTDSVKKVDAASSKAAKSAGVLGTRNQRLAETNSKLANSFATIRSKMLLWSFAMSLGIKQLVDMGRSAAVLEGMETAFGTLSGGAEKASISLDKLREATNNTMSDFDLFQQANNAMILGVSKNSDEMAEVFDIAQRLGRALGKDTAHSVESLITGIGRQSRLMLDNIGIIVKAEEAYEAYAKKLGISADDLTDVQRKQAFLAATMESARKKVLSLGDEVLSTTDSYNQLGTSLEQLKKRVGDAFNAFEPLIKVSKDFLDAITDERIDRFIRAIALIKDVFLGLASVLAVLIIPPLLAFVGVGGTIAAIGTAISGSWILSGLAFLGASYSAVALHDSFKDLISATEELTEKEKNLDKWFKEGAVTLAEIGQTYETAAIEADRFGESIETLTNAALASKLENELLNDVYTKTTEGQREAIDVLLKKIDFIAMEKGMTNELLIVQQHLLDMLEKLEEKKIPEDWLAGHAKFNSAYDSMIGSVERYMTSIDEKDRKDELSAAKNIKSESKRRKAIDDINKKYDKMAEERAKKLKIWKVASAFSNTALAITQTLADPTIPKPLLPPIIGMIAASGAAQIATITAQKFEQGGLVGGRRHSQGGTMIEAEQGEFVMSRNATQAIGIENLNRMNQGGGGAVNVTFTGNVMSQDFIENEAIPQIKEAIRRGADIGVS